jgi:hypothetical protein
VKAAFIGPSQPAISIGADRASGPASKQTRKPKRQLSVRGPDALLLCPPTGVTIVSRRQRGVMIGGTRAAALAVLDEIEGRDVLANARERSAQRKRFARTLEPFAIVGDIRGVACSG